MADPNTPGEKPTEPVVAAPVVEPAPVVAAPPAAETPAPPIVEPKVETPVVAAVDPKAVPEKYDIKDVNPALLEAVTPVFKKAGLSTETAQELARVVTEHNKAMIPQILARDLDTLKADPKLGGLNLARTQARINDALAAFSTPEDRAELAAKGLANNPVLVRMFHRIGVSMQEAPQTEVGAQPRERLPREKRLYGGGDLVTSKTN